MDGVFKSQRKLLLASTIIFDKTYQNYRYWFSMEKKRKIFLNKIMC